MTANIPEIDIAPLIDGSHAAKQSVVGEIEAACADTGFFTIVGGMGSMQTCSTGQGR